MSMRTIKADKNARLGSMAVSAAPAATQRKILSLSVVPVSGNAPDLIVQTASTPKMIRLSLSHRAWQEILLGGLQNLPQIYLVAEDEMILTMQNLIAYEKAEREGIQNVLRERAGGGK